MQWTGAARDHGTFCISCHTALPYALSRTALRPALAEQGPTEIERSLLENVTKRVRLWKNVGPYYSGQGYDSGQRYDHESAESRGTEAVLNALILASHDAQGGALSDDTRAAFNNMWALQQPRGENRGSWPWLQFDQEPWEARDSPYYGAALAAIAVGTAPGNYAATPEIQENLASLRLFLNRERTSQSIINHVFLLLASSKLPGLLTPQEQQAIVREIMSKQQRDGGWRNWLRLRASGMAGACARLSICGCEKTVLRCQVKVTASRPALSRLPCKRWASRATMRNCTVDFLG